MDPCLLGLKLNWSKALYLHISLKHQGHAEAVQCFCGDVEPLEGRCEIGKTNDEMHWLRTVPVHINV